MMDNLIYRQAALDMVNHLTEIYVNNLPPMLDKADVYDNLRLLPSADIQPVQGGHWQEAKTRTYGIYECDVCKGWTYIPNKPRDYKFCPRCGARMDGEQND